MTALKQRFGAMMFLQYAVWGAWAPALGAYLLNNLEFTGGQTGGIYLTLWLGCILAPFLGGQIADRFVPTQVFLALAHLLGGGLVLVAAWQTDFMGMWFWMFLYALCYAPTLALTNSICFHHLADPGRDFGSIRLWGTLGWIVVGLALWGIRGVWHTEEWTTHSDLLLVTAALSLVTAVYCLCLPHTPPRREAGHPLAFLEALRLLKDRNVRVFMVIAFLVTTELQFYYIPTAAFLEDRGVDNSQVTAVMTLAQMAEVLVLMFLLHRSLKHLGLRVTMIIGVLAWPLRYLLFTIPVLGVNIAALTLHGFGFAFFFVASQIYINRKAPDDIRASAQALLTFFTLGFGNFVGALFTGWCMDFFRTPAGEIQWSFFFLVPLTICVGCAVAFALLFRDDISLTDQQIENV